ncbi:MAG: NusG domain II-containing protein [Defluviitaleaceae bacterium]|nr:NusG domain II-containing protein [Defluviitaleaceae bacterium]
MTKILKKTDIILIIALLVLAVGSIFIYVFGVGMTEGTYVVVLIDGRERYVLNMREYDGENFVIHSDRGGTNILAIRGDRVYMADGDCPDHVCVSEGAIRWTWQSITCLPNRVSVVLRGTGRGEWDLNAAAIAR